MLGLDAVALPIEMIVKVVFGSRLGFCLAPATIVARRQVLEQWAAVVDTECRVGNAIEVTHKDFVAMTLKGFFVVFSRVELLLRASVCLLFSQFGCFVG